MGPANASGAVTVRPGDTRTFGIVDTWFKDCSDPVTDDGTAYEAAFFNALLANVRSIVRGNGQTAGAVDVVTQDNGADDLIWQACQHLYQRAQPAWAVDSSVTANQVIIALTPAAAELKAGMRVRVKIANSNTGATTMTVNALNAPCKTVAGQDLQKGMLAAGQIAAFVFDGTNWQLTSVWSEKVVFTPIATISGNAIGSLANSVWGTHTISLGSSANMTPVLGGSSFQLPDGKYSFVVGSQGVTHNNVVNATQIAQGLRLTKNGASVQSDIENTYLLAGQNATTFPQFSCVASVVASDVLSIQSYAAVTSPGDFNGASSTGATLTVVRVGN
ncbi:hypothetical protein EAS62_20260 [Bradyrhizobium zhanjiangense]|uniref:Uncharacterized protein n=1 Tax=Bradyrhizobium zhanjiangense TaxID=1325107 RepID=A0ABY0DIA2_9BRAD|nr:hypothetical protein EAS62_20260 [Bradyrhizobium zhanjiangense]